MLHVVVTAARTTGSSGGGVVVIVIVPVLVVALVAEGWMDGRMGGAQAPKSMGEHANKQKCRSVPTNPPHNPCSR